jgi:hypothetical protein
VPNKSRATRGPIDPGQQGAQQVQGSNGHAALHQRATELDQFASHLLREGWPPPMVFKQLPSSQPVEAWSQHGAPPSCTGQRLLCGSCGWNGTFGAAAAVGCPVQWAQSPPRAASTGFSVNLLEFWMGDKMEQDCGSHGRELWHHRACGHGSRASGQVRSWRL